MKKSILLSLILVVSLQTLGAETLRTQGVVSWRVDSNYATQPQVQQKHIRSLSSEENEALSYLNQLRVGTGLIPLALDDRLNQASQNHADYLLANNIFSHNEINGNPNYTAVKSWERGKHVGYDYSSYGENIAAGDPNVTLAIDGLFTAIYHRLGFLTYTNKELGIGSIYVYDGSYLYGSAHVFNMATEKPIYGNQVASSNPSVILWPYSGYQETQTLFSNTESPDPLPECSYGGPSGNPISIQFNTYKTGSIVTDSFVLYDKNGQVVNTKLLDDQNNDHLGEGEVVLFPINRLDWGSNYSVRYRYHEDGNAKNINWSFRTRKLDYPILKLSEDGATYQVEEGKTYAFYTIPDNCNDLNTYYQNYNDSKLSLVGNWIDPNTIYVKIIANEGDITTLRLGNGKTFTLVVIEEQISRHSNNDFDGDNIPDIVWRNKNNGAMYLRTLNSDGTKKEVTSMGTVSINYEIKGLKDFDGDNIPDIIWRNKNSGAMYLRTLNADGTKKTVTSMGTVSTTYEIKGLKDFDGDNIPDIIWRNKNSGAMYLRTLNADGTKKAVTSMGTVSTTYEIKGLKDFDGDNIPDIVWRNKNSGAMYLRTLNSNGTKKAVTSMGTVSTTYEIAGLQDFDGDNIPDIVWRNKNSGAMYLRTLNSNGTKKAVSYMGTISTSYVINGLKDK